jgi:RNA polymerase sigma factor (sigma-70 family)
VYVSTATPSAAPPAAGRSGHRPYDPVSQLSTREEDELRRRLTRWAARCLGVPRMDFEDTYQEAWCKLLAGERNGRPTRNREHALRWAVHNSWLEELRRRRRRPAVALDSTPEAALVADGTADPVERAELLEATRYLFESVGAVTKRQWEIFLLADVFGLRPREVQERLSISERLYQLDHARALRAISGRLGELLAGDWCEQYRESLDAHAVGEVSACQERQARRHLSNCPACRRRLAARRATRGGGHGGGVGPGQDAGFRANGNLCT